MSICSIISTIWSRSYTVDTPKVSNLHCLDSLTTRTFFTSRLQSRRFTNCLSIDPGALDQFVFLQSVIDDSYTEAPKVVSSAIQNFCLYTESYELNYKRWTISLCSQLQIIKISSLVFYGAERIVISQCPELKALEIGERCGEPSWGKTTKKGVFTVKYCPKLQSIYVGDHSFKFFTRCSLMCTESSSD